jgi:hypothetical protein
LDFQQQLEEDRFAEKLVFSDQAAFRVCGKVNSHIVRIWGTEDPHATMQHVRDSPKVNVFCAVSSLQRLRIIFLCEANCYQYQLPEHAANCG